jgi:hypothetical protein
MPAEPTSPDCEVGKHTACAGDAWDDTRDALTDCCCTCHGGNDVR